jgi:hypothetical protein
MALQPFPYLQRYINRYIARQRAVAVCSVFLWMLSISLLAATGLRHIHRVPNLPTVATRGGRNTIAGVCLVIVMPVVFGFFRRRNPVLAAIEIEQQIPQFDQRLITVASNPPESSLLRQIASEVEAIAGDHRPRVQLRPLLAPVFTVLAAVLMLVIYW